MYKKVAILLTYRDVQNYSLTKGMRGTRGVL